MGLPAVLAAGLLWAAFPAAAQAPGSDLPSGRPDTQQAQNPTDLPDLPSGQSFRPEEKPFTQEPADNPPGNSMGNSGGKPAAESPSPALPAPSFRFRQLTADGLSHTPCWVAGGRIIFIRSEADYDPAGADASFWKKFETGDQGPDSAAVHPLSYARGQLVIRRTDDATGATEKVLTRFQGKHLRGLQCPPAGDYVAVLTGEPGEKPSELAIVNWLVASVSGADTPPPEPVLLSAADIEDFAWADTGERLYLLKDGEPWAINPATGEVTTVTLPPFLRKTEFMAVWGGPRTGDLVLAGLDRDRKGKPFGNSLYVVNVKARTAVRLPPPRKGLGTRFEQWQDGTVLFSSTDFTRFRLFRKELKSGRQTELRPLPGDADGLWRWTGSLNPGDSRNGAAHGIWARWNGAAYDSVSLLGATPDPLQTVREGNFRSVLLSPDGTKAVLDMGTGGSAINGLQIRRDLGLVEIGP